MFLSEFHHGWFIFSSLSAAIPLIVSHVARYALSSLRNIISKVIQNLNQNLK